MSSQPESAVVNAALRWLWARGCFVWRNNVGSGRIEGTNRYVRFSIKGASDIIGIVKREGPHQGKFIACEVKTDIGKVSPAQQEFLDHIKEGGGLAFVVRTSNYSAVIDAALGLES